MSLVFDILRTIVCNLNKNVLSDSLFQSPFESSKICSKAINLKLYNQIHATHSHMT